MAAIDGYLKKEKQAIIADLHKVFSPASDIFTKKYIKSRYESCFNICIKKKPYVRDAMSLAKVLCAQHLEEVLKKEIAKTEQQLTEAQTQEQAPDTRVKRKFIP